MEWCELCRIAINNIKNNNFSEEYIKRLKYEINQIEIQSAESYWLDLYKKHIDNPLYTNKNGLILPFLLGITTIDPIVGETKIMIEDSDGQQMDAVEIKFDNGKKIVISKHTLIEINGKFIKAGDLL